MRGDEIRAASHTVGRRALVNMFENLTLSIYILLILIFALTYDYVAKFSSYWYIRRIPFKRPIFLIGNDLKKIFMPSSGTDTVNKYYQEYRNDKLAGYFSKRTPDLIVRDPDIIRLILNVDCNYFTDRGSPLNNGSDKLLANLFHLDGDKSALIRQRISLAFADENLSEMHSLLVNSVARLRRDAISSGGEINVSELMEQFVSNVIVSCVYGVTNEKSAEQIVNQINNFSYRSISRTIKEYILTSLSSLFNLFQLRITSAGTSVYFQNLTTNAISTYNERGHQPLLNRFIDLQKLGVIEEKVTKSYGDTDYTKVKKVNFDDDVLTAQLFSFISEGLENTSTTLVFALDQLSKDLRVQRGVQQEIDKNISTSGGLVNYESIKSMRYMNSVVDETLRLYPCYSVLRRKCVMPYRLPNSDIVIDKGITVTIPVESIHRDNAYYEDAEIFRPERFLDQNENRRHPFTYLPFGNGPRDCIGQRFAKIVTIIGLTALLQNFIVEPCAEKTTNLQLVDGPFYRRPSSQLWLRLRPREL